MKEYPELEVSLSRRGGRQYALEMRYSQPDSDSDRRLDPVLIEIDPAALLASQGSMAAYGRTLGQMLLGLPDPRSHFDRSLADAQALGMPLRLRLCLDPAAPELHGLRWETICHPSDETPLVMGERVVFSRYLSSRDWRPVRLLARGDLRALVMIANPSNLGNYRGLAPIDVAGEQGRARAALQGIQTSELTAPGSATLPALIEALRGGVDILYLVAHGVLADDGDFALFLEDTTGAVKIATADELIAALASIQNLPRLVVLASCESAGVLADAGNGPRVGEFASFGARLVGAGVSAVMAMNGKVSMDTIARFMPAFFTELNRSGRIDLAASLARGAVRDRGDAWMPTLWMRLRSGRLWYTPALTGGDGREIEEKWDALINDINNERCTPLIGPDLSEGYFGPRRTLAMRMAEQNAFPLAPYDRDSLPQVAQYVAVQRRRTLMYHQLLYYHALELWRRFLPVLPPELAGEPSPNAADRDLLRLINAMLGHAWKSRREHDPAEPYSLLAGLPVPVYVSADISNLLPMALEAAGKQPQLLLCPWNDETARLLPASSRKLDGTPDKPLVYQLFGRLDKPESLVLTEDDFFDYLIGVTRNNKLIPPRVLSALADAALMFLGFQKDDWMFRVFFRSMLQRGGSSRREDYAQIAVQVAPDEDRTLEPERAQRYLHEYFNKGAINVYWGSGEDFIRELDARMRKCV
ncbi:MAG: CHAT domain-containing protein [Roseiflexaceae bacterium]